MAKKSAVDRSTVDAAKDRAVTHDVDRRQRGKRKKLSKKGKIAIWSVVGALLLVFVLNIVILPLTGGGKRVEPVTEYAGNNPYIRVGQGTMLSAHRAGGDLEPEETLAAFKLCMEGDVQVDIVEFDVHLTKDKKLVLLHDHDVDRTSDGEIVFKEMGVTIGEKTLEELKQLNFGYDFKDKEGNYPYREEGANLDDVRILALDEILDYLEHTARTDGSLNYIIEIKDKGASGKESMDLLYSTMEEFGITQRTIVGTFNADITKYIDQKYSDVVRRSASILEVLNFYYAFLWGVNPGNVGFSVLQIPMGLRGFFDFATAAFIDYAHSYDIAVQYWTINDPEDVARLVENGADAIMTDDPSMAVQYIYAE